MKEIIKKLFNLYDKEDFNAKLNETYIEAYEKGKKTGEEEAIFKKYSPNEIRTLLGLTPLPPNGMYQVKLDE